MQGADLGGMDASMSADGKWAQSSARRSDLRRRLAPALAERVVVRLEYLSEGERAVLRSVIVDHRPVKDIAPMTGSSARVLRRRVNRAILRVLGARFAFVLERRGSWTPTRRRVATLCFIDGRSVRDAARELGLSLHAVRRHREAIEALYSEDRTMAPTARSAAALATATRTTR